MMRVEALDFLLNCLASRNPNIAIITTSTTTSYFEATNDESRKKMFNRFTKKHEGKSILDYDTVAFR